MRRELLWGWTAELDGPPRELEWNQLLGILQDLKYLLYHSPVCQCPLSRETAIRGGDEVAPEIWGTCCVQRGSRCRLWRFGWNPFQDSRIRDYQWLPCHTVSIRNPQISRTRFVVDCSAFLPALGWLVAFCAAKAWRTNAHSLRSLGTQSREDRKREKEKSRRVYGESFFRCFAQVRHSEARQNLFRICCHLKILCPFPGLSFSASLDSTKGFVVLAQTSSHKAICEHRSSRIKSINLSSFTDQWWDVRCVEYHVSHQRIRRSDFWWATMKSNDKPWLERVFGLQTATAWFLSMGERYQQERESAEHGKMSMSIAGRGLMMLPDLSGGCSAVALCGAVVLKSFEILDPYIWSFKPARLF